MNIRVTQKDGLYGIMEDDTVIVPCCNTKIDGAVDQWIRFRKRHNKEPFLKHTISDQRVNEIAKNLRNYNN